MKYSPKQIGLWQAAALSAYIGLFATAVFVVQHWAQAHHLALHPVAGIALFLFVFVISALVSGSLVFAYPIALFFDGHKREAMRVVFWSLLWLVVIFTLVAGSIFIVNFAR